ncbi:MAG: GntR family transcriptional regulator [Acetobacteraceae bacterium]|nr:GntR family transcriptional regulator [Acetobacteraceae bacterium]
MATELQARSVKEAASVPRRRGDRPRTIPEQIADHLGTAILRGEYAAGERIREQEVAQLYGVSRGPVREAIRSLARRGMVEFYPRRGAYAVGVSLDLIADFFNLRAALLGLAARCFVRVASPAGMAELEAGISRLRSLAADPLTDPVAFALEVGRAGATLYRHCGNAHLVRTLREQVHGSLWGLIWRERPLDFFTPERRRQTLDIFLGIEAAARQGDEGEAERLTRRLLFESRDHALETLAAIRQEAVDPTKMLTAD